MKKHLKTILIFLLTLVLIVALYCVCFYRENTMKEDVLYTTNVDLDMESKKETIVRISNHSGTESIYEVRWSDGRKSAFYETFAESKIAKSFYDYSYDMNFKSFSYSNYLDGIDLDIRKNAPRRRFFEQGVILGCRQKIRSENLLTGSPGGWSRSAIPFMILRSFRTASSVPRIC